MIKNIFLFTHKIKKTTDVDSYYYDYDLYDCTDEIVSDVQYQTRKDKVFASGTFSFLSKTLDKNISPYTICVIENDDDTRTYWMASSESHHNIVENEWMHNVTILEATSVLSTHILGAKTFSTTGTHKKVYQQIAIAVFLINQKYGVNYKLNKKNPEYYIDDGYAEDSFMMKFNEEIEHSIPESSQLWTALCILSNDFGYIPKVDVIGIDESNSKFSCSYNITFIKNDNIVTINDENITDESYIQPIDSYCKIMESVVNDVVDRDTTIRVENIVAKADFALTDSEAYIELPCNAEKVSKFEVNFSDYLKIAITFVTFNYNPDNLQRLYYYSYNELKNNSKFSPVFAWISQYFVGYDVTKCTVYYETDYLCYIRIPYDKMDLSNKVVEKSVYDVLDVAEKPKYAYYEKYGNKILGLYEPYRKTFYDALLGQIVLPFLSYCNQHSNLNIPTSFDGNPVSYTIAENGMSDNPVYYTYNVEFTPKVNLYIVDKKNVSDGNDKVGTFEYNSQVSTTYNGSSGIIDFDRVINDIHKENLNVGRIGKSITVYGQCDVVAGNKILNDDVYWYVESTVTTSDLKQVEYTVINLSKTETKIADAIGLKTQFESTPNPLETSVDRHIYVEKDMNNESFDVSNVFIRLAIIVDGKEKQLYKRACPVVCGNDVYFTLECLDNYCFDTYSEEYTSSKRYMQDAPYVDSKNELNQFWLSFWRISNLSLKQAYAMPNFNYQVGAEIDILPIQLYDNYQKVYKDAREKLVFTIRLKNVNLT